MRKIELVCLHELLLLVRYEYERRLGHAIECNEYDRLDIRPIAITQPKAKHDEAVRALASDLAMAVTEHSSSDTDTDLERSVGHHKS